MIDKNYGQMRTVYIQVRHKLLKQVFWFNFEHCRLGDKMYLRKLMCIIFSVMVDTTCTCISFVCVCVGGGGGWKGENDDMMIYTKYKLMFAHYDLKFPVFVSIIDWMIQLCTGRIRFKYRKINNIHSSRDKDWGTKI